MEELASEAGISLRQLKRILDGTKSYLATIQLLAAALNTSPDSLRADIEVSTSDAKTRFSYNLTVEGAMDAGRQFDPLVQLTPRIIALLTERGIKVSAHVSNLNITEHANDAVYRVLTWYTLDIEGKTCWWFVAVKPDKLEQLARETQDSGEPFIDFEPYGELLSDCPISEIKQPVGNGIWPQCLWVRAG
jgi:transcriptional regulator with XRE-family HTH domain